MLARITPSPLKGTVPAIASKSMAHRLIICAALANGETHVTCNTTCADIEATVRCLTALGARIETVEDGFQVHPTMKSVEFGLLKALAGSTLDCGESGSTLRFMLPVACALGADATFVGQGRLGARPLSPLSDEIIAAGCDLQGLGGFPLKTSGRMRPGTFELPGNVSSQYISGLLLAAPLLAQPSCVQVTGLIESRPYINLTIQAMKAFGIEVNVERIPAKDGQPEVTNFRVNSGSYRTPGSVAVAASPTGSPPKETGPTPPFGCAPAPSAPTPSPSRAYRSAPHRVTATCLPRSRALAPVSCAPPTPLPSSPTSSPALR